MAVDFTSPAYTEVDPDGVLTVTSNKVDSSGLDGDSNDSYVYYDYGAGFFGDVWSHVHEGYCNSSSTFDDRVAIWALANGVNDMVDLAGSTDVIYIVYEDRDTGSSENRIALSCTWTTGTPGSDADASDGRHSTGQPDLHRGPGQLRRPGYAVPDTGGRARHPLHIRPCFGGYGPALRPLHGWRD